MRKGPAAEAESDASQHAVGGTARVFFILFIFIYQFNIYFLLLCVDQWTQHDQRKAPWGEPTTREGVRKGPAAEAERDASQHAVGGLAWVFFILFIFIYQFKFLFI